jgi:hypothetical protein
MNFPFKAPSWDIRQDELLPAKLIPGPGDLPGNVRHCAVSEGRFTGFWAAQVPTKMFQCYRRWP